MNYEKLSASMAALVEEFQFQGTAMMMMAGPRAVPLASDDVTAPPAVFAYLRCDSDARIDLIPGVNVHSRRGKVRTALVSLDGLDQLSERKDVYLISPAVSMKPLNDVAALKTGLPTYKNNTNGSGKGVIVGIVDSGIDALHPAFSSRIHSIWDQTITGTGWGNTNYGTVLTGSSLAVSSDTNGHGTHVAGIAAGDDANFGGVAPEANIVVVKTNFLNLGIGDGIRYIFAIADQLGMPAVVNLSLGGHHDAHDGSDDLSELINERTGEGRIVVAAAGNEGGDDIHAGVEIPAGQVAEISFMVPPNSQPGSTPFVRLNGWYGQDGDCEISVQTSSGNATAFQPVISNGRPSKTYNFSNAVLRLTTPSPSSTPNGDHHFLAELFPGPFSSFVQGGVWRLQVRNNGPQDARINVWSIVPQGARDAAFLPPFNSPDMKIGSPGSSEQAITVASYTTRNSWQDSSGATRAVGLTVDTISDFSSPGPLRSGMHKPDITAPGAMIVSCLSGQSSPPPSNIISSKFRVNAGTSMACPYITGLVALLLQVDPTLNTSSLKARLQAHSAIPGVPPGAFNNQWGFGLIDAGSL
jgi:subtilisin family serine protease